MTKRKYCHEWKRHRPHHFIIPGVASRLAEGVCKKCGFKKLFQNSWVGIRFN